MNKKDSEKKSPYNKETQRHIINIYKLLSEKDSRLYAAGEALKLPWGGQSYISKLLGCSRATILRGIKELKNFKILERNRIRKPGGGRKSALDIIEKIDDIFLKIIDDYIAGDPTSENIRWTNLSQKQISEKMKSQGVDISVTVVKKLLKKHGFVRRKALKKKATGHSMHRNEQFENITLLKKAYTASGGPVVSVDTKKKSL